MPVWIVWAVLVPAALFTATVSGILGMAGGIMLLGAMTAVMAAEAVVPVHGAVQFSSNFTRTMAFRKKIRWKVTVVYCLPLTAGVAGAALVWGGDVLRWFKAAIGVFLIAFLIYRRINPKVRTLPLWTYVPLGLVTGFLTIFVGATGPFIAPFFLRDDFSKEEVIATKAVCQSWGHVLKFPVFLALMSTDVYLDHLPLMLAMIGAVVLGTFAGKWVLKRMTQRTFVRIFEIVLSLIAVYLIVVGVRELM